MLAGNAGVRVEHEVGSSTVRWLEVQAVTDIEKHEQAFKVVVAIRAPPENVQEQVQLSRGEDGDGGRFSSVDGGDHCAGSRLIPSTSLIRMAST